MLFNYRCRQLFIVAAASIAATITVPAMAGSQDLSKFGTLRAPAAAPAALGQGELMLSQVKAPNPQFLKWNRRRVPLSLVPACHDQANEVLQRSLGDERDCLYLRDRSTSKTN